MIAHEEAKYINTAETTHLSEREACCSTIIASKSAVKHEKRVFLVEGAMDVLAFEKADMHNGAGDAGHCLHRKSSCSLLKALHAPITICYDGDAAGQNATYKFAKQAVRGRACPSRS